MNGRHGLTKTGTVSQKGSGEHRSTQLSCDPQYQILNDLLSLNFLESF